MKRFGGRTRLVPIAAAVASLLVLTECAAASAHGSDSDAEMVAANAWAAPEATPFSFVYGGCPALDLLARWEKSVSTRQLDAARTRQTITYVDPMTGLQLRSDAIIYRDFPAVERVLRFKNTGTADTPILENIRALDVRMPLDSESGRAPILHYAKGAVCSIDDFAPVDKTLGPGSRLHLQPGGGRSSSEVLPFFNLDLGRNGFLFAIGWTGEWAADFHRTTTDTTVGAGIAHRGRSFRHSPLLPSGVDELRIQSGMAATHLTLHPGEEIRTPSILVICWQGEAIRGNNLLRRFLLKHRRPRPNGKPLVLPVSTFGWGHEPIATHMARVQRIIDQKLPIDLYWIDAGWFGGEPWWKNAGNWEIRKDLYPEGLRPLADKLHASGRQLLLWFEPHRVCQNTPWAKLRTQRPGWLLELGAGKPEYKQHNLDWKIPHDDPRWVLWESHRSQIAENDMLWNLGNRDARRFLTNAIAARINDFKLDWYREDFNIAPAEFWEHADTPDRQGMTEIRFIEGLYTLWDDLLAKDPGLAIDNCASGGRRIDLETIGRSTPLWNSDWPADAIHKQCHTFGLLSWVPLSMADGVPLAGNKYELRSSMTAGLAVKLPEKDDAESFKQARAEIEQYRSIRKFYYGDYYPLTKYSQSRDAWMAYQLDLPESGEGLLVVFRRPESNQRKQTLRLKSLLPDSTYRLTNLDTGRVETSTGRRLTDTGVEVELPKQPDSALIRYCRTSE